MKSLLPFNMKHIFTNKMLWSCVKLFHQGNMLSILFGTISSYDLTGIFNETWLGTKSSHLGFYGTVRWNKIQPLYLFILFIFGHHCSFVACTNYPSSYLCAMADKRRLQGTYYVHFPVQYFLFMRAKPFDSFSLSLSLSVSLSLSLTQLFGKHNMTQWTTTYVWGDACVNNDACCWKKHVALSVTVLYSMPTWLSTKSVSSLLDLESGTKEPFEI